MKIYNELESLGFFEWLKEKGFGSGFTPMILDAQLFDSIERSGYNAIAFRWFREKYGYFVSINPIGHNITYFHYIITEKSNSLPNILDKEYSCYYGQLISTYEEAELECLVKLIDIVKKNKF